MAYCESCFLDKMKKLMNHERTEDKNELNDGCDVLLGIR